MIKKIACTFILGISMIIVNGHSYAADTKASIEKLLQLPISQYQGGCLRSVISEDVNGKELFAVEKCPFVKNADIAITPETETTEASKGKFKITMQCTIKNNDYYTGKLKKSFNQERGASIVADYMYALEDLSLKNVEVEGDKFCAHPIMKRLKTFQ